MARDTESNESDRALLDVGSVALAELASRESYSVFLEVVDRMSEHIFLELTRTSDRDGLLVLHAQARLLHQLRNRMVSLRSKGGKSIVINA